MKTTYFHSKWYIPRSNNLDKKITSRDLHRQSSSDLLDDNIEEEKKD